MEMLHSKKFKQKWKQAVELVPKLFFLSMYVLGHGTGFGGKRFYVLSATVYQLSATVREILVSKFCPFQQPI